MTHATRRDVTLHAASDDENYGVFWYAMIGSRCLAMIHHTDTPQEVCTIIDAALAILNADTEAYMASIS